MRIKLRMGREMIKKSGNLKTIEQAVQDDLAAQPKLPVWDMDRWFGADKRRATAQRIVVHELAAGIMSLLDEIVTLTETGGFNAKRLEGNTSRLYVLDVMRGVVLHVCAGLKVPQAMVETVPMGDEERACLVLVQEARSLLQKDGTGRFSVGESVTGAVADSLNYAIECGVYAQGRAQAELEALAEMDLGGEIASVRTKAL
jgi:hypothetical protein